MVVIPSSRFGSGDTELTGPHTVCVSGLVDGFSLLAPRDDDDVLEETVVVDIPEPHWAPEPIRASSMTSWGEIYSHDSDEVDHSRWGIREIETGYHDFVIGTRVARHLRLLLKVVL